MTIGMPLKYCRTQLLARFPKRPDALVSALACNAASFQSNSSCPFLFKLCQLGRRVVDYAVCEEFAIGTMYFRAN